jgi:hypothetical protein
MSNDKSIGCCDEPPCPSVSLLCNSISASKSKCGFTGFTTSKKYLVKDSDCSETGHGTAAGFLRHTHWIYTYDPSTCTSSRSITANTCVTSAGADCTATPATQCPGCSASFTCLSSGTCAQTTSTTDTNQTITCDGLTTPGNGCSCNTGTFVYSVTLSSESTTATLISTTESALPSYATCFSCVLHCTDTDCDTSLATGQGCTCTAFRNLSSDETSYTIRRFKYKFRFEASVTCRLKILWNETFKPTLTAGVDFCGSHYNAGQEDPNPAHWTKTAKSYNASTGGDPCGPNIGPPSLPTGDVTERDSSVFTVNEPSTNGTTYITDIRWTILDGNNDTDDYEPAGIDYSDPCNPIAAEQNCIPAE